jgi:hypothetical protein
VCFESLGLVQGLNAGEDSSFPSELMVHCGQESFLWARVLCSDLSSLPGLHPVVWFPWKNPNLIGLEEGTGGVCGQAPCCLHQDFVSIRNRLLVTSGLPGCYLQVWQIAEDSGE